MIIKDTEKNKADDNEETDLPNADATQTEDGSMNETTSLPAIAGELTQPQAAFDNNWMSAQERKTDAIGVDSLSRLSTMPLAVLLPTLGDVSRLALFMERLEGRYRQLQADKLSSLEESESATRHGEESMLNQVLQWLSTGGKDGGV